MHASLMGLQVDSVASAIHQNQQGKGVIISDQTGIGKGRQAAAIIRWADRAGHIPVFLTAKPSLFTDMYGDLHDIGTDDINPFIVNLDQSIKGPGDEKLFANKPASHKRTLEEIAETGKLPAGRDAVVVPNSQNNLDQVHASEFQALPPTT